MGLKVNCIGVWSLKTETLSSLGVDEATLNECCGRLPVARMAMMVTVRTGEFPMCIHADFSTRVVLA